jgi:hypothetical protein
MAEQKAELKVVRARQRCEPGRARLEDTLDDVLEADVDFDHRRWDLMDGNFIREKPPPKPKDTHKQSTLPECLTSARSAKAVRHASPAINAQKLDDGKLFPHPCPQLTASVRASSCSLHSRRTSSPQSLPLFFASAVIALVLSSA